MENNWLTIENQDGVVVLTKCSNEAKGEIIIPEGVMTIDECAFTGCMDLVSIVIPQSVTKILDRAFEDCEGLSSVVISNSVKSIGNYAFAGCTSLISIIIPQSVDSIGDSAFDDCIGLTSIVVEPGNKFYDSRDNCNAIIETAENIIIADCQKTIVPQGITSICIRGYRKWRFEVEQKKEDVCLKGCEFDWYYPAQMTIPNYITSIGPAAFLDCEGIESFIIPNSVKSIGNGAFKLCLELNSLIIPDSVISIGDEAFASCMKLESVIIPKNVTSIGCGVFSNCDGLASIVVSPDNPIYDSRDNCNAIVETASNKLIAGCPKSRIPDSVKCIAQGAFDEIDLSLFVVPESVEVIESDAFGGCYGNIFIPESLANPDIDSSGNCKICAYKTIK